MKNQLTVISVGVLLLFSAGINVMQYQSNDELKRYTENRISIKRFGYRSIYRAMHGVYQYYEEQQINRPEYR